MTFKIRIPQFYDYFLLAKWQNISDFIVGIFQVYYEIGHKQVK